MEADVSHDFQDYWNEYRTIEELRSHEHSLSEEDLPDGECWVEREWLESAGLGGIVEPAWTQGREVGSEDLEQAMRGLTWTQAQAVRRRVDLLNRTLRQRRSRHHHRPRTHVSQLFKEIESCSTESRSRSATPDSLDSDPPSPPSPGQDSDENNHQTLRFVPGLPIIHKNEGSRRRLANSPNSAVLPPQSLFRRSSRSGGDIVASEYAEGIKMVGYQRLGSVRVRSKSGSDPVSINSLIEQDTGHNKHALVCVTRSHDSLYDGSRRHSPDTQLGFEEMWAGDSLSTSINSSQEEEFSRWDSNSGDKTWVDFLAEEDMVTLRPLVFMELTALMDSAGLTVSKAKPPKRKRKEDGSVFGVSLSTLLEKDQQIVSEPHSVPLVFQKVLGELERRGLREEGVLRVAGNRQKVESLISHLDRDFYSRPELIDHLLACSTVHELTSLLKRLLRSLPQPLLTPHLLHLFYLSHSVSDCLRALNLLVLLMPTEHRATLHCLLAFLNSIVSNQLHNKMSNHNVAMIIAPSLFPPNILTENNGLKAELGLAVQCCRLTELMMESTQKLWLVPDNLVSQLRAINESHRHKENKPISRLLGKKGSRGAVVAVGREEEQVILSVDAPQFCLHPVALRLDKQTTAADILLRIVEYGREAPSRVKLTKRSDLKHRALSELAPNGNLSCLLSTGDPETALQTHFLYEIGGNIGQRRLDQNARMLLIYHNNPNAKWVIRCDHRNGSHRILGRV